MIAKAFELYGSGQFNKQKTLEKVTALGQRTGKGTPMSAQSIDAILRNPIFTGWMIVSDWGIKERGNFEPLISEECFYRVQAILNGKHPAATMHKLNHPDFPLQRFVFCSVCGKPITGGWSKGRNKHYGYYRCSNPECMAFNIPKAKLEDLFLDRIRLLKPRPAVLRLFREIVVDT